MFFGAADLRRHDCDDAVLRLYSDPLLVSAPVDRAVREARSLETDVVSKLPSSNVRIYLEPA